ncbi:hypothetical protein DTO013E5_462 [Penicillium roqueforti]|uniref:Genomic scaffold, ProqFM164S02 n=1 Tax=Penicillium roqueforti (strain FM164) TaxID=1365484 RepID=W6Q9M2_PENRF|nr:uncharacterized protein LCP9604111_676 [Penicillium roqueforti]CDM30889.1 unnamed protein product [Penicillium roqueforti FM164]KAF9253150.1 hypothetical protein LCP9604111_676 [Penicillium roqueforti]KAI1838667.1 hypothetical protein CBS147337_392 [Penicillium roqueforti]KAI2680435.1 hypothetical protein CBS147355_3415 [Penicillium roqueforti]KAI2691176.1 hypothetical protein LCP963914a_1377 [Penicillium roqueforti]
MHDQKNQNPSEDRGRYHEEEAADQPPAYIAGPAIQPSRSPAQAPHQTSHKPIAIPAITSSSDSPFIRAYAPILRNHQLPKESFLSFLDQLNKDIAASPPLQVLDATGGILKSVPILFPLHWIGGVVSGLANMGSQGMSKSRTDSSIKQANRDIFRPRGLEVEIAKLDALAHVAKLPILDSQGKIDRQAPLFLQLQDGVSMANPGTDERQQQELDLQQRISTLQPWIAELEFDILPWSSKSRLTRFNASLKKYNEPEYQEKRGMGRRGDVYIQETPQEEAPFRKALWLVIREVETDERR